MNTSGYFSQCKYIRSTCVYKIKKIKKLEKMAMYNKI